MGFPAAIIPILLVFLFSGAGNTLIAGWMDKIQAPTTSGGPDEPFKHPFIQCFVMFIGEGACLGVFAARHANAKRRLSRNALNGQTSPWRKETMLFAVPASFDWVSSTMTYISFSYLPASSVQMLRGSLIIFVCLLSVFVLKNKLFGHHFVGVGCVVLGICFVALSSLMDSNTSNSGPAGKSPLVGIAICLVSQMFASFIFTSEEALFKRIENMPPMMAVGMEGCSGLILGVFILIGAELLGEDNFGQFSKQAAHSWQVVLACAMLAFSIAFFNVTGQKITKALSSMARSALDSTRTILVWIGELAFGWRAFAYDEIAFWMQPFGFLFIVLGTMLYFNTIKIKSLMGEEEIAEMEKSLLDAQERELKEMGGGRSARELDNQVQI